jgi:hypothetical protein
LLVVGLAFAVSLVIARWRRRFQTTALVWVTIELVLLGALVWGLAIVWSIPCVRYHEAVFVVTPLDLVLPSSGKSGGAGTRWRASVFWCWSRCSP